MAVPRVPASHVDKRSIVSLHSLAVCPFCSQPLRPLQALDRATVAYCDACEVGRLDPPPGAAANSQQRGSQAGAEDPDEAEQLARTFRRKLGRLLRYGSIRDLLQIGSGAGAFLREAGLMGIPRVVGVETDSDAADAARSAGLEVHPGPIVALPPTQQFDAIVLLDALEQVREPIPFLSSLRPHLRSGGHLFVMTPNIRSLVARLYGARWRPFAQSDRVYHYGPRGIRLLLERTGFDPVWVRGTGQYVTLGSLFRRLAPLAPRLAPIAGSAARLLHLDGRVVYAPNGAMDVVARARRSPGLEGQAV